MKTMLMLIVMIGAALSGGFARMHSAADSEPIALAQDDVNIRFEVIDVMIDSGEIPLAAYQLEVWAETEDGAAATTVRIVGIEGGEAEVFRHPPYYDPAAMQDNRVIIGDFSTAAAGELPSGKTRIASVHVQITGGEPTFKFRLDVAGDVDGREIPARVTLQIGQES